MTDRELLERYSQPVDSSMLVDGKTVEEYVQEKEDVDAVP